jgi:lipopolysaccharide cholinephosphotransferase
MFQKKFILLTLLVISINYTNCQDQFTQIDTKVVQKIYQTLCDVHDFFNTYNIPYFIDCGTLLGAVRHGGLIPWDDDLDLCIFEKDEQNFLKLFPILQNFGYSIIGMPFGYKIYPDDGEVVNGHPWKHPGCDIFIMTTDDKKVFYKYRSSEQPKYNTTVDLSDIFPLRNYDFGPLQVKGPKEPMPILNNWYGSDCLSIAYIYYDHSTEQAVKKEAKTLKGDDFKPAKPAGPLIHNIRPTYIPQWPLDFMDKYPKANQ